jgi:hypothetical protein
MGISPYEKGEGHWPPLPSVPELPAAEMILQVQVKPSLSSWSPLMFISYLDTGGPKIPKL